MTEIPTSYHEARMIFIERRARGTLKRGVKLANNTYLTWSDDAGDPIEFGIRLHNTEVVTFHHNGDIDLDSGGWDTVTTKQRMNACLGRYNYQARNLRADLHVEWSIYQTKFRWYVTKRTLKNGHPIGPDLDYLYADGMTLHADGMVSNHGDV